jgi:phage repressor protein C with HTH and peptisase S24 domain
VGVVSNLNDEAYVKVLKKNKLVLESINDKYSNIAIKSTDYFNIVGRVIEIRYREVLKKKLKNSILLRRRN